MPCLATEPRLKSLQDRGFEETQWNLVHARYQGWMLARFLSPDPRQARGAKQQPQSWNLYSYGRNNPVTYVDADGSRAEKAVQKDRIVVTIYASFYGKGARTMGGRLGAALNKKFQGVKAGGKSFRFKVDAVFSEHASAPGILQQKRDKDEGRDIILVGPGASSGFKADAFGGGRRFHDPSTSAEGALDTSASADELAHEGGHLLGLPDMKTANVPCPTPCSFMYETQGTPLVEDVNLVMKRVPDEK